MDNMTPKILNMAPQRMLNINTTVLAPSEKEKYSSDPVYKYFDIRDEVITCKIANCQVRLTTRYKFNLKKHLISKHKNVAKAEGWISGEPICPVETPVSTVKYVPRPLPTQSLTTKETVNLNLVKLFTEDEVPLSILNKKSFIALLNPVMKSFNINLSREDILQKIEKTTEYINEIIQTEIHNNLVCLKIDSATHNDRTILGFHVQYLDGTKLKVRTLSFLDLQNINAGSHLQTEIVQILASFCMDIKKIYACVLDSSANMVVGEKTKLTNLMHSSANESTCNFTNETLVLVDDRWTVVSFRCIANTLQTALTDWFADKLCKEQMESIRNLVSRFQKNPLHHELSIQLNNLPQPDNHQKWQTTYAMILALHEQKTKISSALLIYDDELYKTFDSCIAFIDSLQKILQQFVNVAKSLQEDQLTLGCVYKVWLELELELEDLDCGVYDNAIRERLLMILAEKKKQIFANDVFLAAIYLDPRFNFTRSKFLTDVNKFRAKEHLLKIHSHIQKGRQPSKSNVASEDEIDEPTSASKKPRLDLPKEDSVSIPDTTKLSRLELKLMLEERLLLQQQKSISIDAKLTQLCSRTRLAFDGDILKYWENSRALDNDIYELAQVVFSVPGTQATCSRSDHILNLILSNPDYELSDENINILMLKFNKELLSTANYKN